MHRTDRAPSPRLSSHKACVQRKRREVAYRNTKEVGTGKQRRLWTTDGTEGDFLTPRRVQKVTQVCPGIIASYYSFGETVGKACLGAARLAGCCAEGSSGKCLSKLPQRADCCSSQTFSGAEEVAQWLRTHPVPAEDLSSVDSTHVTVDNHAQL